jgi:uncharacterized ferritin-like protein (DUF455 family)
MNFLKILEQVCSEIILEKKKKNEVLSFADLISKKRAPIHKPTQNIRPKKGGGYKRQEFKNMD